MTDTGPVLVSPRSRVDLERRQAANGHKGAVFWMSGFSGAGKSTIAHLVEEALFEQGVQAVVLDGDNIRSGLNADLGFNDEDRHENIRRAAEAAKLLSRAGLVVLCSLITPTRELRRLARSIVGEGAFFGVFIDCPLEECERRDCKGFYSKARQGLIKNYTGLSSRFEPPEEADCRLCTAGVSPEESANELLAFIRERI